MSAPGFDTRERCPACLGQPDPICDMPMDDGEVRAYLESFYEPVGAIDFSQLVGARFRLLGCSRCGCVWQAEAPNDALSLELYEHWIDPVRSYRRFHAHPPMAGRQAVLRELATGIAWLGQRVSPIRFLDIGGGWGEWCEAARILGCEPTLLEISPSRIVHARNRGISVLAPDSSERFDLVNLEQVAEHVADPVAMLELAKRSLAPRGLIRVCVPNGRDIRRRLRRMDWTAAKGTRWSLNLISPLEHINCLTADSLEALARRCGLTRVRPPLHLWLRHGCGQLPREILRSVAEWCWHSSPWSTRWWLRPADDVRP